MIELTEQEKQLTTKELEHYTNLWCKSIGIKSRDLGADISIIDEAGKNKHKHIKAHNSIDDIILLMNFRDEFWLDMNRAERGVWAALWSWCYHRSFRLKQKHLRKLQILANSVEFKRYKQAQRLGTIRQLRKQRTKTTS